jgi:S1-C subfamily serine protease/tetratricopeptide (TPR) repeat protein
MGWAGGVVATVVIAAQLTGWPTVGPLARGQEATTADTRLPSPAAADVDLETKNIREILADAFATAAKQKDFEPLVADLNQRAAREESPAHRYALYKEAERLAVEAGLYGKALEIAAERCRQFKADTLDTRMAALDRIVKQADDAGNELGMEFAKRTVDVALAAESFPAAERAADTLVELVKRQTADIAKRRAAITKKYKKKIPLPNLLGSLATDVTAIKEEVAKCARRRAEYDAVAGRLKAGGGDEAAAAAGAAYLALQRNDWPAALPFLRRVRGPVGTAAKGELDARGKNSAEALAEAANAWWTLGETPTENWNTDPLDAAAYKSHAADCYLAALPKLSGKVARDLATTRIREAPAPRSLRTVEADALNCRTASEARQVYKVHAANAANPPFLAGAIEARSQHWEQLASQKRVKLGNRWLKPGDHERETAAADDKVAHARDLLRGGQFELAKKELDEASALNPETAKAEFFIGMVYAVMDNDLLAIEHWLEGLKREPNHACLLNNLAVSEVVSGRHRSAINHFRQASRLLPEPAIVGNIAFAVKLSGTLGVKGKDLDDLNDLARQTQAMLRSVPQPSRDPNAGAGQPNAGGTDIATANRFVYVSPYGKGWDGAGVAGSAGGGGGAGGDKGRGSESLGSVAIGYGTGFVVAPGVVLTNEHVVRSAREIVVHDPADFTRQLVATVIASDKDLDLALLVVKDLKAPPLKLAEALPPRTTDIMAMGFPGGPNLLGNRLKSTKGSVIAPGDPTLDGGNFLHSCLINPGNSGGPIVDEFGEVIGVVRAIAKISEIGDSYSIGIPVDRVLPFFNEHRAKFEPPPPPPPPEGQPPPPADPAAPATPPAVDPAAPPPPGGVRGQAEAVKSQVEAGGDGAADPAAKPKESGRRKSRSKARAEAESKAQEEGGGTEGEKDDAKSAEKPAPERKKMAWPEVDEEASRSVLLIVCKEAAR